MAQRNADQYAVPLRMINNRLSSTPHWQLPQVVPFLADTIGKCSPVLSDADAVAHGFKDGSDVGMLIHRVKTRMSNLLQDKSPQARWAAVVLSKAIIEAGGVDALQGSSAWVRLMIGSLGRPDPPSTKKLCIITLTRCFLLAQGHQSLVRELATPVLPAFLTACLKLLRGRPITDESLLLVTLQALNELLPFHPASFRPFQAQIRSCILPMLAPTPSSLQIDHDSESSSPWTNTVADSARRMFVLLSVCAPKKSEGDSWSRSVRLLCDTVHCTIDNVFRAIIEDRGSTRIRQTLQSTAETVSSDKEDPMELPGWTGVQGGIERLLGLLRTLQAFIATSFDFTVTTPVGVLLDIFNRMLSMVPPFTGAQVNAEIGRDEREGLVHALPVIHATAIDLLSSLTQRLGQGAASFYQEILEQCLWVLNVERSSSELRIATYRLVRLSVLRFGLSFPDSLRAPLSNCLSICCGEIIPSEKDNGSGNSATVKCVQKPTSNGNNGTNAESYFKSTLKRPHLTRSPMNVQVAAARLLSIALRCLPEGFLSPVRADMDRIAVLTGNESMLLASVLYPPPAAQNHRTPTSLMPFLSRAFPGLSPVEALMKPRMPVVQCKQDGSGQSYVRDQAREIEEPTYDLLYSGTGFGKFEIDPRESIIEDSTQAGKDNVEAMTATTSHESLVPVYTHPQTANTSIIEVPETQPATLPIDETHGHRDTQEDPVAVQWPSAKRQQDEPSAQTESNAKRPRLADTLIGGPEIRSHIAAPVQEAQVLPMEASPPTGTRTAPALPPNLTNEETAGTDSDYSSVHLDPTLSTDEENDDDEDDV